MRLTIVNADHPDGLLAPLDEGRSRRRLNLEWLKPTFADRASRSLLELDGLSIRRIRR